ncbi:MAG TPA: M20/M25/M40 family metallo-hydrolase [Pyrinomonadaceae bacterium]|nr:M20/M25/M40 family metallo-hydrolase [Pyrinomonadaceae bacterium]
MKCIETHISKKYQSMNIFDLTKALMNVPSISGEEEAVGFFLRDYLQSLGWTVELQPVTENQNNVIAYLNETPRVWLSTHMDTVPPFIAPTEDDKKIYGRGSCDAKGIIAAQITAAELLRKEGIEDIGLLYTVEEERASTGAKVANNHRLAAKCEYMINGEPTDNDLAIGSKGAFRAMIRTTGTAAHSAYPEQGDSAIEKLLDILEDVRHTKFPNDDFFGETTCNIATIDGGVALNVIPPNAEAGLLIRLTTPMEPIRDVLVSLIRGRGELEILSYSLPVKMLDLDGFKQKVVRFTTDIPHLPNWGQPLLLGPGSILVAHTKDEFVPKSELEQTVGLYRALCSRLLTK